MLDECKGEKLEEVISAFAMTTLRKTARASNDTRLELACSDRLSGQQQAQLLPMIIAHRNSLQQHLSHRREIQSHAEVYNGLLAQRHASIEDRRTLFSTLPMLKKQIAGFGQDIADSWVGDYRWAEILLSGTARSDDRFLEAPFETGWKTVLDGQNVGVGHHGALLEDLNARIVNQETRLRKWKTFAASLRNAEAKRKQALPAPAPAPAPAPMPFEKRNSAMLQFDRHQSLPLPATFQSAPPVDQHAPTASIHKLLLASMQTEIASLGRRKPAKPTTHSEGQGSESRSSFDHEQMETERWQKRRFNGSTVGLTVPMVKPGSLNSEATSLSGPRPSKDTSAWHREPMSIASQHLESEPTGIKNSMNDMAPKGGIQSGKAHLDAPFVVHPMSSGYKQYFGTDINPLETLSIQGQLDKPPTTPSSSTPTTDTPTLFAEGRDDKEMEEQIELSMSEPQATPSKEALEFTMIDRRGMRTVAPPPTLLERTRQSMSFLPNPAGRAGLRSSDKRASSKQTRMSQAFPINQFETPRKMKTAESLQLDASTPRSGSSTPRDELFSDAAAYDSVFKSRPRIATSPALSPDRSGMGLDSMLEEDLTDLPLYGDQ